MRSPPSSFCFVPKVVAPIIHLCAGIARTGPYAFPATHPSARSPISTAEMISAIVPARNEEANIAQAVRSLAQQAEVVEIIVVNDQSTDGTSAVLRELAASQPKLRVLEAGSLPEGWVGKNHAVWLGAEQATGQWLLFTDADAVHLPGSAARALADAAASGAAIVSYSPRQEMHAWWEHALIPFIFCRLSQLYSYAAVNDPESPAAAANGQYLLAGSRTHMGDRRPCRCACGKCLKMSRSRQACQGRLRSDSLRAWRPDCPGEDVYKFRSHVGRVDEENLFPLVTGPQQSVTRELLAVIPWIPLLCLALTALYPVIGVLGVLLLAGRHASYAAMLRRNRFPVRGVIYYGVAVVLYCAALLVSEWHYAHGKVSWKGREYPVGEPGA